ncbi:hypothetical protein WK80_17205 [Burkholderia multivorans]|uniref:DUF3304 domain-containing protein n=1 Tax=Burkholderia multivorans TaxID=87883 RepID=UPI000751DDAA|nr:DUF3304 domain-containing protein [Burkholderia multivorans]KVV25935.1 hypothetical protein WK80_17205 [Burkholderia multivorans]MBU9205338.1 DUF3304 domain-containing protein [Burkholderia multivorans]MCA8388294.1 DUF3304 domain-containing protein [Burkholderia multivorans]MCA8440888.1 DUF3304 domain-containing protein [Burkholderia multivorans]MCO8318685.1 DUF3304 domain-containing protein [Burkholderia multivorans]
MRHTAPQCRAIARRRRNAASASARAFVVLRIAAANLLFVSIAACSKSEPTYVAVSTEALNYLPYNLVRFTITDQYGNRARGGGDLEPGAGEGSIACCYSLKGTNFKVQWTYYDADDWRPGEQVKKQQAEANASLAPTNVPDSIGSRILEIHFYPDHHVELAFPGEMLGSTRLPIVDVSRELTKRYGKQLDEKYGDNDAQLHRRISRTVAAAWLKYRFTDRDDLAQYAYFALLVNARFDAHPAVQKRIRSSNGTRGAFAKEMAALSPDIAAELAQDRFPSVAVPPIEAGLLPPPRDDSRGSRG